MEDRITVTRSELKEIVKNLVQSELKEMVGKFDIFNRAIQSKHIDSRETGLYFETSGTTKRIGIGGLDQYLYKGAAGEIRVYTTLISDGDIIAVGGSANAIRIYSSTGKLVFGDGADGYDTNLYRVSANTLATDDDLKFATSTKGPTLIDRTTATVYRIKVDSGVLGVEAA